jgi:asparagine synthetase B (glutamine-hydrolysing)
MCSFIVTNTRLTEKTIAKANRFSKARGPDATKHVHDPETGIHWIHNLLHITGDKTIQPFLNHDLVYVFNGQVYNYKEFVPTASSDGYCIAPVYRNGSLGELDGEFAIVINDKAKNKIEVVSDAFALKPCWISIEGDRFAICSYRSSNRALGFKRAFKTNPNTRYVLDLNTMTIERSEIYTFDLRQFKGSFDDWCHLFDLSVKKRIENTNEKFFVGLSSGYDSGCIVSSLQKHGARFTTYSVRAAENLDVLQRRHDRLDKAKRHLMHMTQQDFDRHRRYVGKECEYYRSEYFIMNRYYVVQKDKGAFGTSFVCSHAKNDGFKIYMSGHGADEVYSDYGFRGRPIPGFEHCDIAGHYPEDLRTCFPWKNFTGYRMIDFAYKDESVGGSYGLEVRYPFLDRALVQEFLNVQSGLKNAKYKAPLHQYLESNDYPFVGGHQHKVGFRATANLVGARRKWSLLRRR